MATATARHRGEVAESLHELPVFLRELGPYLKQLEKFAAQATPTFTDLGVAAPGINRTFENTRAVLHQHDAVLPEPRQVLQDDRARRSSPPSRC